MLGIEVPIVQAGMGYVARGELAAGVSAAGGLGVIGAASLTAEGLREEIRKVRGLTDRPFGVDVLFATIGRPAAGEAAAAFTREVRAQIDVVFEERVPVLASGLGNPGPVVPTAHELGIKVIALVGNTRSAARVAASGVDIVVAQGYDAGGHTGRIGTMTLLPAVIDTVDVPVLAAGGIGDGRGIAAALVMGAIGVWMGTRFVACKEAFAHDAYKQRIVEIDEEGTTRTRCFSGKPCRVIKNQTTEAWEAPELTQKIEPFPMQLGVIARWLGTDPYLAARREGRIEIGAMAAGQSSCLIHDVPSAAELIERLVEEAGEALSRAVPAAPASSGASAAERSEPRAQ
jgi:enoyl-[acyl-carrier protein] reductase II